MFTKKAANKNQIAKNVCEVLLHKKNYNINK